MAYVSIKRLLTIVLGSVVLTCLLGICVDLVTAHVAVEYFTVHHPRVMNTESPWVMALIWGIGASWWFGAIAGTIVGIVNYLRLKPLEPIIILKWAVISCVVIWLVMILILSAVYLLANQVPLEKRRPSYEFDRRIMAVAMAHQYEYFFGAASLIIIAIKTWLKK